jgi:type IV secretory pathway VirB9-like protein
MIDEENEENTRMKKDWMFTGATVAALLASTAAHAQTREVTVTPRSVVSIDAKLRYTTMLILPEGEEILDLICGDKDFWIVSGAQNFAYIKPAKVGAATNLNVVTASGTVYSFVLTEGAASPDLKVFVVPDRSLLPQASRPRLYSSADIERIRQDADAARRASDTARQEAEAARDAAVRASEEATTRFRATYPTRLQFPYQFAARTKPFQVSAMYHDGQSTFIRIQGSELPAVYELRDGAANLVNVQVENETLIVPKVLATGYLAIGKQRFVFTDRLRSGR